MTGEECDATILLMATKGKPGRRPGTPLEYQEALMMRLHAGRKAAELKGPEMAERLSKTLGREILADTYRKWEKDSLLPMDAILPVCDLIKVHVLKFLEPVTDKEREIIKKSASQKIRYLKPAHSGS
jgi:hypothetical protein